MGGGEKEQLIIAVANKYLGEVFAICIKSASELLCKVRVHRFCLLAEIPSIFQDVFGLQRFALLVLVWSQTCDIL